MTGDVKQYEIGLYASYADIPAGSHGFTEVSDSLKSPQGPHYKWSEEELALFERAKTTREAELTLETAPTSVEKLVEIAKSDESSPGLFVEKQRIIGSRIRYSGDVDGMSGTIGNFFARKRGSDEAEVLTFELTDTNYFKPGEDFPDDKPEAWHLTTPDFHMLRIDELDRAIQFYYKGFEWTIGRHPVGAEAVAARKELEKARKDVDFTMHRRKFYEALRTEDYDPRLASFLLKTWMADKS